METTTTPTTGNVIDRAADTADAAIAATHRVTTNVLTGVSDKLHSLRDKASPAVDKISAPLDAASAYAQQAPLKSLLIAAAVGAAAMALVSLLSRSR